MGVEVKGAGDGVVIADRIATMVVTTQAGVLVGVQSVVHW